MRIIIGYLPLELEGKYISISQQRFAKAREDFEAIYPVSMASGATLLNNHGHEVKHVDGILKRLSVDEFMKVITDFQPQLLVFETKTPVVKNNWTVADKIKKKFPYMKIAVCGDHVTVLPEETLENSAVDFVITGGDFDISMADLADYLEGKRNMPPGIYYKVNGNIENTGPYQLIKDLDSLPFIDREIVPWHEYHEAWRLYKRFMYIMTSRGCAYNCTFCSWSQMLYNGKLRLRSAEKVVEEIEYLKKKYRVQELFFDSDTFTRPKRWVHEFCQELLKKRIKVMWSCNGHVNDVDYEMLKLMKAAGCRMIKFGVESASQETLDRIKKNYTVEQVRNAFAICKKVGIHTHATAMIGFYWESKKDMLDVVNFIRELNPYEAQFSMPLAYPGTALFEEAKMGGWLRFPPGEWREYDMALPSLKNSRVSAEEIVNIYTNAWKNFYLHPRFIFSRLSTIKSWKDVVLSWRGFKTLIKGHIKPAKASR